MQETGHFWKRDTLMTIRDADCCYYLLDGLLVISDPHCVQVENCLMPIGFIEYCFNLLDVNFTLPFSIFGYKPHGFIWPVSIPSSEI